jgi:xylan 1,4-beta-xylosidase
LVWHYEDESKASGDADVKLAIAGLPKDVSRVLLRHYRIDQTHSNAYTAWQGMGSPQQPDEKQYGSLEASVQLQLLSSPEWLNAGGNVSIGFLLPPQSLSLLELTW